MIRGSASAEGTHQQLAMRLRSNRHSCVLHEGGFDLWLPADMQLARVLAWQCRVIRHGPRRLHVRAQGAKHVKRGQHSTAEQPVYVGEYVAANCPSCQQRLNSRSSKTSGPLGKLEQHLKR